MDKDRLLKVKKALTFVSKKLNESKIPWLLGASGALMVHGVNIVPYDLDIFVTKADVYRIAEVFNKYLKNPVHDYRDETGTYVECQLDIEGIEVEICELNGKEIPSGQSVNFDSEIVYVNSLEHELSFYKKRQGKEDLVKLIQEKLKK